MAVFNQNTNKIQSLILNFYFFLNAFINLKSHIESLDFLSHQRHLS
jgi:hypothetical protein